MIQGPNVEINPLKRILQTLLLFCACAAWAQSAQVVVPGDMANVEGNSAASEPFNSASFRFQQVFDASQFAFVGGATARVAQVAFRIDGASQSDVLMFFGGSTVVLSTTQLAPDTLSSVFDDNRGPDWLTVRTGAAAFGGSPPSPGFPAAFDAMLSFEVPFLYRPSQGNLLMEVAGVDGRVFFPGALDGHALGGDSISWVFSNSNLSPSGATDTFGLVTRFSITVIPEPATWLFAATGLAVIIVFKRRRKYGPLGRTTSRIS